MASTPDYGSPSQTFLARMSFLAQDADTQRYLRFLSGLVLDATELARRPGAEGGTAREFYAPDQLPVMRFRVPGWRTNFLVSPPEDQELSVWDDHPGLVWIWKHARRMELNNLTGGSPIGLLAASDRGRWLDDDDYLLDGEPDDTQEALSQYEICRIQDTGTSRGPWYVFHPTEKLVDGTPALVKVWYQRGQGFQASTPLTNLHSLSSFFLRLLVAEIISIPLADTLLGFDEFTRKLEQHPVRIMEAADGNRRLEFSIQEGLDPFMVVEWQMSETGRGRDSRHLGGFENQAEAIALLDQRVQELLASGYRDVLKDALSKS